MPDLALGPFDLLRPLGRGGTGLVWEAHAFYRDQQKAGVRVAQCAARLLAACAVLRDREAFRRYTGDARALPTLDGSLLRQVGEALVLAARAAADADWGEEAHTAWELALHQWEGLGFHDRAELARAELAATRRVRP